VNAPRSILFNLGFFIGTGVLAVLFLPVLLLPRRVSVRAYGLWAAWVDFLLRWVIGARVEIRGVLPRGPCVIAAKHQSAWETIALLALLDDTCFVVKRELGWIPFFGWHVIIGRHVLVDRKAGARALRHLVKEARKVLAAGRQLVIFPQGTRVAPDVKAPYQPGVTAVYSHLGVPVIPMALNSGLVWGRRSFHKAPGTIVVQFLDPIEPGLERATFAAELERRIEQATAQLVAEGRESLAAAGASCAANG
jgi:1-acyl-sn-glycerol-3-phosphate acyltransferase